MSEKKHPLALARACVERMLAADAATRGLGMSVEIPAPGQAIVHMRVTDDMLNGHNICHGGYVFTLADSAFAFACNAYDNVTVSSGASVDFLRAAKSGETLVARAEEVSRSRRFGLYDVSVENEHGDRIALFRGCCVALGKPVLASN